MYVVFKRGSFSFQWAEIAEVTPKKLRLKAPSQFTVQPPARWITDYSVYREIDKTWVIVTVNTGELAQQITAQLQEVLQMQQSQMRALEQQHQQELDSLIESLRNDHARA